MSVSSSNSTSNSITMASVGLDGRNGPRPTGLGVHPSLADAKSVSSFDLELNPFEQSFASTKKPLPVGSLAGTPGNRPAMFDNHRYSSSLQQAHMLSPGGSKRLPPLLLSPTYMVTSNSQNMGATPLLKQEQIQTPGFFIGSGLTPNEISLRTGLTPLGGAVSSTHSFLPLITGQNQPIGTSNQLGIATNTAPGLSALLSFKNATSPNTAAASIQGPPQSMSRTNPSANGLPYLPVNTNSQLLQKQQPLAPPPTKKRRHDPATQPFFNGLSPAPSNKTLDEAPEEDDSRRRQEFLERNRLAASKFRQRKKQYIKKIEEDLAFYKTEYANLTQLINTLTGNPAQRHNASNSVLASLQRAIATQDLDAAASTLGSILTLVNATNYKIRNGVDPRANSSDFYDNLLD